MTIENESNLSKQGTFWSQDSSKQRAEVVQTREGNRREKPDSEEADSETAAEKSAWGRHSGRGHPMTSCHRHRRRRAFVAADSTTSPRCRCELAARGEQLAMADVAVEQLASAKKIYRSNRSEFATFLQMSEWRFMKRTNRLRCNDERISAKLHLHLPKRDEIFVKTPLHFQVVTEKASFIPLKHVLIRKRTCKTNQQRKKLRIDRWNAWNRI